MLPSASIILDLETGRQRSRERMLKALGEIPRQIADDLIPGSALRHETLVCFHRADATEAELLQLLSAASGDLGQWPGTVRLMECAGEPRIDKYYQKTNLAAKQSHNILLFVDSDLLLEPGCLKNLLTPFGDYRKWVVVGSIYVDGQTTYERAMALLWIF